MVKPECSGITVAKDNMKTTEDIWVECHNKLYSFIRSQVHVKGSENTFELNLRWKATSREKRRWLKAEQQMPMQLFFQLLTPQLSVIQ